MWVEIWLFGGDDDNAEVDIGGEGVVREGIDISSGTFAANTSDPGGPILASFNDELVFFGSVKSDITDDNIERRFGAFEAAAEEEGISADTHDRGFGEIGFVRI